MNNMDNKQSEVKPWYKRTWAIILFVILGLWFLISLGSNEEDTPNDDYDSDGLTDNEENTLGTNYKLVDTDFDGLTDYQEVYSKKTNPLNENTDNDRYNDFDDKEPLLTNSANISINFKDANITLSELLEISAELYKLYNDPTQILYLIATTDTTKQNNQRSVIITNTGDDYSSYVSFDVVTYGVTIASEIGDDWLCSKKTTVWEGKVDSTGFMFDTEPIKEGESIEKTFQFGTKVINEGIEFPEECRSIVCSCETTYLYKIENIEYEKFG